MKVPNNFLLYVTILSLSLVLVSRGIRDLAYPNTFTRHVNDQLRERGTLSGPQPPDPESEIEIAGHKLDRNYYGGPYYFAGTKVRAGWFEIGDECFIQVTEQRITYEYDPKSKTWSLTK